MSQTNVLRLLSVSLLLVGLGLSGLGCKSSTSPNASTTSSGTLIYCDGNSSGAVGDAVLGSNTSTIRFTGYDPAFAIGGRVISAIAGTSTGNGMEHIDVSSPDGTNAQIIVDFQAPVNSVHSHPRMSPDGKYVCFNYWPYSTALNTHYGTLIYSSTGTQLFYIENYWDGSWAPDGSLIVSGTVTDRGGIGRTNSTTGLFKVSSSFGSITPIGSGLATPQLPAVSPDGTKIAFLSNQHIWVIGMDGTGLKQVTTGGNIESYSAWSPDGSEIAVISYGDVGFTTRNAVAIVSANQSTPVTVSPSASVWVQDNGNVPLNPDQGNLDWKR